MELFLQQLPFNQKQHSLEQQIRRAVRTLSGKKIEIYLSIFRRNRSNAILTLPCQNTALRFLAQYEKNGLYLRDRRGNYRRVSVKCGKNEPNPRLVEGLRAKMDDIESESSDVDIASPLAVSEKEVPPKCVSFEKVQWGMWLSNGTFGHCGELKYDGELTYNSRSGELEAQWLIGGFQESGIVIDNIIIREILLDRKRDYARIYFTLDRIPRFWSLSNIANESDSHVDVDDLDSLLRQLGQDWSVEEPKRFRLPSLSPQHKIAAAYCTVYAFEDSGMLNNLSRLLKSMRRSTPHKVVIRTVQLGLSQLLEQLTHLYTEYEYSVAFQLELLVKNCLLSPHEILSLSSEIDILLEEFGTAKTIQIIQNFSSRLPLRTFETLSQIPNLHAMMRAAADACVGYPLPQSTPNLVAVHTLDVMPAGYNLEGPVWIGSNRVLRLFPKNRDCFVKVTFTEEDLTRIHQNRDYDLSVILQRWSTILSDGISIADRRFHFIGFSQSSLKDHSAWFMLSFEHEGRDMKPALLHKKLGDFYKIRCPPRLAARLGQTFTNTTHSIEINANSELSCVADIKRNGHIFSDGVGRISQGMIERIWKATGSEEDAVKPVAYQIRLGGSKGVLSLDTTIQGDHIYLRDSMTKFDAKNQFLELANKGKILPFYLNRQIIVVLETLGVSVESFFAILQTELSHLKRASRDLSEAVRLYQRQSLGQSANLTSILRTLQQEGLGDALQIPFFHELNSLALSHVLKQIKYKSRINVGSSWKLIGILDEFDYLKEDEIYVCLRDETDGTVRYLEGDTLVTRSPTMHCGDIQIVHAVGKMDPCHPLAALHNCIVFSTKGARPIPNMLAGGDLDGDLFDVSQNPSLLPSMTKEPDFYPTPSPLQLDRDCTMDDITNFFINFIVNDNLGQLCTRHAIIADQSPIGVMSEDCIQLSRLASVAVDFPKTGIPVYIREAPWIETRIKPDFMASYPLTEEDYRANSADSNSSLYGTHPDRQHYYKSTKVLGKLYRHIDIKELLSVWNSDIKETTRDVSVLWAKIEGNLRKLVPLYEDLWKDFVQEAEEMFETYVEELTDLQRRFHPTPWRDLYLTEAEVFMQCLKTNPLTKSVRGRGREDYLRSLRSEYRRLVEWVLSEIWKTSEGRFQRAAAYFYVGIHASKRSEGNLGESFAWIVVPDVFAAWKRVERNGFMDGEDSV